MRRGPGRVVLLGGLLTVAAGCQMTGSGGLPEEVDAGNGCISLSSPLGRSLMNKAPGDEVEVTTPAGKRSYEIMELRTLHEAGTDEANEED